jgi:hypothetical protein
MKKEDLKEYIKHVIVKEFNAISTGGGALASSGQMAGTSSAEAWGKKPAKKRDSQKESTEYNEDPNMLTERMIQQLDPNMKVVVHKESPGVVIIVVQDHEGDEFGEIQIARSEEDGCIGAWEVIMASAHKGYGPFLYDVAMELVGNSGLMSDRQTTSNDARNVWRYYYNNRKDVMKKPVEYDCEVTQKTPMEELNYVYYKNNKNITTQLKKNNQIVFKKQ